MSKKLPPPLNLSVVSQPGSRTPKSRTPKRPVTPPHPGDITGSTDSLFDTDPMEPEPMISPTPLSTHATIGSALTRPATTPGSLTLPTPKKSSPKKGPKKSSPKKGPKNKSPKNSKRKSPKKGGPPKRKKSRSRKSRSRKRRSRKIKTKMMRY